MCMVYALGTDSLFVVTGPLFLNVFQSKNHSQDFEVSTMVYALSSLLGQIIHSSKKKIHSPDIDNALCSN